MHQREVDEDGEERSPPVVVAVDPQSPASQAGITAGDTILGFRDPNGHAVSLGSIRTLRPGRRITARIRRNGIREFPVVIGVRPEPKEINIEVNADSGGFWPQKVMQKVMVFMPIARMMNDGTFVLGGAAGAQVVPVNADLADALNMRAEGLLVTAVAAGTPAARSGVRSGDVIVGVDGRHIANANTLLQAILKAVSGNNAEESGIAIALEVKHKGKSRWLTLRW